MQIIIHFCLKKVGGRLSYISERGCRRAAEFFSKNTQYVVFSSERFKLKILDENNLPDDQLARNTHESVDLAGVNLPPMFGRRDAAYHRAEELLFSNLQESNCNNRRSKYRDIIELFRDAVEAGENIISALRNSETAARERGMLNYMRMLRNFMLAAEDMAGFEIALSTEDDVESVNDLVGDNIFDQLLGNGQIFFNSEKQMLNNAVKLVKTAKPRIDRYINFARNNFSRENADRYKRAYKEFSNIYREFGSEKDQDN